MKNVDTLLSEAYSKALEEVAEAGKIQSDLDREHSEAIDTIIAESEANRGVYTVVITSVVYKMLHPEQDIRKHQSSIPGGYSGRTFDTKHITPFLKKCSFPSMSESGWLTRSLEQKVAYDRNYTGAIKKKLKQSFLLVLNDIEEKALSPEKVLDYMLQALVIQREQKKIALAVPQNLSIEEIVNLLDRHFHSTYKSHGAARLPVLALYAAYECVVNECRRYEDKVLQPLESHTSADSQSGRIGDIEVDNSDSTPYEAVEVKFDIPVSIDIVLTAKNKIEKTKVKRYYILSTKNPVESDLTEIQKTVRKLKNTHGCQMVVNGVKPTLKYYLRLLDDTAVFIDHYTSLLSSDKAVLFEHKEEWNNLVSTL